MTDDKKPNSNDRAIAERRSELRGGRSVRQVSRDQWELDYRDPIKPYPIVNRKSWARNPLEREPQRKS
jgi:hypothetical protein